MKHTQNFLKWVFEHYCDSETGNFARENFNSEYGISSSEMLERYYLGAIEDAENYLEAHKDAEKVIINYYISYMKDSIKQYTDEIEAYTS